MIVDVDDKGQVVTGRWTGKMARPGSRMKTTSLTMSKLLCLSALENKPQKWDMDIFADSGLTLREQDTAILYVYFRLVGEH